MRRAAPSVGSFAGDVDRHEGRVEAAFDGARMVEVPLRRAQGDVLHLVLQAVGNVDVGVDDRGASRELAGAPVELGRLTSALGPAASRSPSRFAKRRKAPGTPAGSWRKKARPV